MALLIELEILAARYARLIRIGDRSGAKAVADEMRAIRAQILRGLA